MQRPFALAAVAAMALGAMTMAAETQAAPLRAIPENAIQPAAQVDIQKAQASEAPWIRDRRWHKRRHHRWNYDPDGYRYGYGRHHRHHRHHRRHVYVQPFFGFPFFIQPHHHRHRW
jgi:hypothetical protein